MKLSSRSLAESRSEFAVKFAAAQDQLREDPYRLGLPSPELGRRFAEAPMPFASEFWILESDAGTPLGRIAANVSLSLPGIGFVGFFEAVNFSAAQQLVMAALEWLKTRGIRHVYGPVNFNTWLPYRFRIHEDSSPQFAWEPINPPEYPKWFADLGFSPGAQYHTDGLDGLGGLLEGTAKDFQRSKDLGYSIRSVDSSRLLDREVKLLYDISMPTFKKNFLFEAVPFEFYRELYVPLASKADVSLARFGCDPQGKEVAYFFLFQEGEYLVAKTVGVLPEAQGKGLSNALLHSAVQQAMDHGMTRSIMALMKSGIQSESYGRKQNQLWKHEYVLFERRLGD